MTTIDAAQNDLPLPPLQPPPPNYTFLLVTPSTPNLAELSQQFKEYRLSALELSPRSFSEPYAYAASLSDEEWIERLVSTKKRHVFCMYHDPKPLTTINGDVNGIAPTSCKPTIAASLTLNGPFPLSTFTLPPECNQPPVLSPEIAENWHLSALYVPPNHRGQSLGKHLISFALQHLKSYAVQPPQVVVQLGVLPWNPAQKLYRDLGWTDAGNCSLAEALVFNGEEVLVPSEEVLVREAEKYRTRIGLLMQRVLVR